MGAFDDHAIPGLRSPENVLPESARNGGVQKDVRSRRQGGPRVFGIDRGDRHLTIKQGVDVALLSQEPVDPGSGDRLGTTSHNQLWHVHPFAFPIWRRSELSGQSAYHVSNQSD